MVCRGIKSRILEKIVQVVLLSASSSGVSTNINPAPVQLSLCLKNSSIDAAGKRMNLYSAVVFIQDAG